MKRQQDSVFLQGLLRSEQVARIREVLSPNTQRDQPGDCRWLPGTRALCHHLVFASQGLLGTRSKDQA